MQASLARLVRTLSRVQSDQTLLRAYATAGDPAAVAELVRRYTDLARRAAAEVYPPATDDVAQATLDLLARNAATVGERVSAAGWVFETARRLALKARSAAARRAAHEGQASPPAAPIDPLDAITLAEVRAAVAEEVARLPEELRVPLVLCYWDGADRATAAQRLGCSMSTLKRRLHAGRDRLATRLARRGFAGPAVLVALTAVVSEVAAAVPVLRTVGRGVAPRKALVALVCAVGFAAAGVIAAVAIPGPVPFASPELPETPEPLVERSLSDRLGDPLPVGAIARLGTRRFHHGGEIDAVAYSPDGKMIASGGLGGIMLWNAGTRQPLAPRLPHGRTCGLAFTPDGKTMVSAGSPSLDGDRPSVVFWDLGRRERVGVVACRDNDLLRTVAVSPNGKTVVALDGAGRLTAINAANRTVTWAMRIQAEESVIAYGLSFAPNGDVLAVATAHAVVLLDVTTGKQTGSLKTGRGTGAVTFTTDGRSVWVGRGTPVVSPEQREPGRIALWDLTTGAEVRSFETVPDMVTALAVSPDGKTVASIGGAGSGPYLWDARTGKGTNLAPDPTQQQGGMRGLAFAPDGTTLAATDPSGRVRVWDVATRRELHRHGAHAGGMCQVAASPDGMYAATVGEDGTVRTWEVATGRPVGGWAADERGRATLVRYTPDGRHLITAGGDGTVRLWDTATGREVRRLGEPAGSRRVSLWGGQQFTVSPDGTRIAVSGESGQLPALYETATGRRVREFAVPRVNPPYAGQVSGLAFSPDGRRLVGTFTQWFRDRCGPDEARDARRVLVWDAATGDPAFEIAAERPHGAVAVSPDGRVIAGSGLPDGEPATCVVFWSATTGSELVGRRIRNDKTGGFPPGSSDELSGLVHSQRRDKFVAFSPDGRYLATDAGGTVRLVEVASGAVVCVFESGASAVTGLVFTAGGQRLISAHDDGTGLVWDMSPQAVKLTASELWAGLAATDTTGWRAVRALEADPTAAVALLGEKIKPAVKPKGERTTAALIADLGDPVFAVREAASRELARRVSVDAAELNAAMVKAESVEVRQRLDVVLRAAPGPWPKQTGDELRTIRAVGVLAAIGSPAARRLLQSLADGDPYASRTQEARAALHRLGG